MHAGCPTTINNVETISSIPAILKRGPAWYSSLGRPGNAGTKLFSIRCGRGGHPAPCALLPGRGLAF